MLSKKLKNYYDYNYCKYYSNTIIKTNEKKKRKSDECKILIHL
jgi:hypothetical protein